MLDDRLIDSLVNILEQEASAYEDMLEISRNKTGVIVEGKVGELDRIVKLEQSIVLQMGRLEDQREGLVRKISGDIGVKPEEITVSGIIKLIGKTGKEKLKAVQARMAGILKDVRSSNDLNTKLIKDSLDYIKFSLNIFANYENADNNYSPDGDKPTGKSKSFF